MSHQCFAVVNVSHHKLTKLIGCSPSAMSKASAIVTAWAKSHARISAILEAARAWIASYASATRPGELEATLTAAKSNFAFGKELIPTIIKHVCLPQAMHWSPHFGDILLCVELAKTSTNFC